MRKPSTANHFKGKIDYTKLKELDKEIEVDFADDVLSIKTEREKNTAVEETVYLNSIPGLVDSIKAADYEPLDSMDEYKPDEEW